MFKKLIIRNFQSHKETTLKFHPGVNVIAGMSNSGKTAIVRAMRLLFSNRPSGAQYYSNSAPDSGQTEVDLLLEDGRWVGISKEVKRKDGVKKLNATNYFLDEDGWKHGTKVPDEVSKALNIGDINISTQFDKHFLILSSPGEVARTINRLTKLEQVDEWKSDLSKRINRENNDAKLLKGQLAELEAEIAKIAHFEQMRGDVDKLVNLESNLNSDIARKNGIDGVLIKIERVEQELKKKVDPSGLEQDYRKILALDKEIEKLAGQQLVLNRISVVDNDVEALQDYLSDLQKLMEYLEREEQAQELGSLLTLIAQYGTDIVGLATMLEDAKESYILKISEDNACPFCLGPIDDKTIKRIQEQI